ncbi:MAG: DNA repair protein RadA [Nocardioides sp.]
MARSTTKFRCSECGWETMKWVGRCGECQAWGSVAEVGAEVTARVQPTAASTPAIPISQVSTAEAARRSCGVPELDRVLGGGLVPGAAILLAGEPGVGKSTLLLEVASQSARYRHRTLYVTGEESASQVRLRADRTGNVHDELFLAAETDLGTILGHIEATRPELLVVDSVQTINVAGVDGVPGGVTQVKEVAAALVRAAKTRNMTTILVGHVTKDGSIAGPRVLEHLVDVVLSFEGDSESRFRMARAVKNRFGPIDEVGCFDLTAHGIEGVSDPTGLFVEHMAGSVPGTCVAATVHGRRPMLVEVQGLVTEPVERPRRTVTGLDPGRASIVLAVLERHIGIPLNRLDVFAATVGGAKLVDPASDLAVAVAIASAATQRPAVKGVVAIGEIGLAGELRRVRDLELRISEAARLGFSVAIVPAERGGPQGERVVDGMTVLEFADANSALREALGRIGSARS